jgi:hypothetical protein
MEFKAFSSISKMGKMQMQITQKLHGSNAVICIYPKEDGTLDLRCGSRTRWLAVHDDNYGFCNFVESNRDAFIAKLGLGYHYGEWVGLGINSGEGLQEKILALFDFWRYRNEEGNLDLPERVTVVPLLYKGPIDFSKVAETMEDLKTNGSKLVPGFMRPEGVVIQLAGVRYKEVFEIEEVAWTKKTGKKNSNPKIIVDFNHLCQPLRLEKLLSRDERYTRDFPENLPGIVKDYVADLVKEGQISGTEDEIKSIKKAASNQIFKFVRTLAEERS